MKKYTGLTYQKKLKILGWAVIPAFLICYQLAFARTIAEYKTYRQHSSTIAQIDNGNRSTHQLQIKSRQVDTLLQAYTLDTTNQNRNLLEIVTDFCHDYPLQLKDYKPLPVYSIDSINILTRTLTIEGDFINCLHLVHALEKQYRAGRISAVQYKSYKEITDQEFHLLCTIYVQNIIK